MPKKIIYVLGCTGMLGKDVLNVFIKKKKYKIYSSYRNKKYLISFDNKFKNCSFFKLDVNYEKDLKNFAKILKKNSIIINCIGLIKPYISESYSKSIKSAIYINSYFPNILNDLSKQKNCKVYQIATDCVFSGLKGNYNECNPHDATDVYGKTKSLGEIKDKNFFNIRTSIIGEENFNKISLIEWFKSSPKNSVLNGFKNHHWNGVTTKVFAELICSILDMSIKENVIHLTPRDKVNKFELLQLLKEKFKRNDIKINKISFKNSIDRTLKTNHNEIVEKIWKKSIFGKKLTIKDMILKHL